jgi:hypothetical protein
MTENPEVVLHSIFENASDLEELVSCISAFLDGDPGEHSTDDEVLGFISRNLDGKIRHGVYETTTAGRIHIVGDDNKLMVMPDVVFAQGTADLPGTINTGRQNSNQDNAN